MKNILHIIDFEKIAKTLVAGVAFLVEYLSI
jgi:hypothetical protein